MPRSITKSSRTGRFVDDAEAQDNPAETVVLTVRTAADQELELRTLVEQFVSELPDRFTHQERHAWGLVTERELMRARLIVHRFELWAVGRIHQRDE